MSSPTLPGLAFATTYHVTVTSSTRAGEQATGAVDLTTPGHPTSPQTAIGSGAILLDGQPWFPLLVYGQCSTLYDSSINTGITLFVANPCGGLGTELETLGGRALSAALSDEPVVSGAGLIGTFYPDEADDHGYTGLIYPRYRAASASSPCRITSTRRCPTRSRTNGLSRSCGTRERHRVRPYPLQGWCRRNRLRDVYAAQRELVALSGNKPTFQWIESAGMNCPNDPTDHHARNRTRGIMARNRRRSTRSRLFSAAWTGDVGRAITQIKAEIAGLLPALLQPPMQLSTGAPDDEVIAADWTLAGATYIVAINTGGTSVDATLNVPGLASRTSLVLGEQRTATSTGDQLRDHFTPLAVHIYAAAPPAR